MKLRKITIRKDDLYKDLESRTYKAAETAIVETVAADKVSIDAEDTLDGSIVSRLLAFREAKIRKRLVFCLKPQLFREDDNANDYTANFVYKLGLPNEFQDVNLEIATTLLHEYLVRGTLMDWYNENGIALGKELPYEVLSLENQIIEALRTPSFVKHPAAPYTPSYRIR